MDLQHPDLGRIRGFLTHHDVVQYRGVPYGSLNRRFSLAKLKRELSPDNNVFDAQNFGAQAPQLPRMMEHDLEVYGGKSQDLLGREPPMNEFDCLNLVITKPISANAGSNLPVLFWIHGGNLMSGSNWYPASDPTALVARSIMNDSPIVVVSVNYRLGFFALLYSNELAEYTGTKGNLCFYDQALALEWVHEFIYGFGGNPDSITCAGVSAGAGSTQIMMLSDVPRFNQAICMSGSAPLLGTPPHTTHEAIYQDIISKLGLESLTAEQRLEKLTTLPMKEIIYSIPPGATFRVNVDGEFVTEPLNWAMFTEERALAKHNWCHALLAGELADDSSILTYLTYSKWPRPGTSICRAFRHILGEEDAKRVLSEYLLTDDLDDDVAIWRIHDLVQDLAFALPMFRIAQGWHDTSRSFYYHLVEPIKWEHLFKGKAPHLWDTALLFGNMSSELDEEQNAVSRKMQDDFIRFINSNPDGPWASVKKGKIRVYGSGDWGGEKATPLTSEQFEKWQTIKEVGHDRIWGALNDGFLASGPRGYQT